MDNRSRIKTILYFSLPSILSMLLSTSITITDGYFIGNYVGGKALAAINLGLPILYIFLGTGLSIGVGGSVISAQLLGCKENNKASKVFIQSIVTASIISLALSILALIFLSPIISFLGAEGETAWHCT